jgi:hypothetical protein
MDRSLFPFETLTPNGIPQTDGDKAFDAEELPLTPPSLPALQVVTWG